LLALDNFSGIAVEMKEIAQAILAEQLAFHLRGCVSFWIAGELQDEELGSAFEAGARVLLLSFASPMRRTYLVGQIKSFVGASVEKADPTSLV
jgi:hypothetical protein